MNMDCPFQSLKTKELNIILKHVRLGKNHLSTILDPLELNELLENGDLKDKQKENLKTDAQEKTGNIVLVLNTIITSFIGAWLGMAAFGNFSLRSIMTVIIAIISLLVGGLVGYLSYQLTKRQAQAAMTQQRLRNIEITIFNILLAKRRKIIDKAKSSICNFLEVLFKKKSNLIITEENYLTLLIPESDVILIDVFKSFINEIQEPTLKKYLLKTISSICRSIEKIALKLSETEDPCASKSIKQKIDNAPSYSQHHTSFVKILINHDLSIKKIEVGISKWLQENILALAVGLMPTVLGGFASMFVFLDGVPNIFKEFHWSAGVGGSYLLAAKIISLMLAFAITLYFGYSHIHTSFKNYKRSKQIELSDNIITEKSEIIARQAMIHYLIVRLKYRLSYLDLIYQILQNAEPDKFLTNNKISKFGKFVTPE